MTLSISEIAGALREVDKLIASGAEMSDDKRARHIAEALVAQACLRVPMLLHVAMESSANPFAHSRWYFEFEDAAWFGFRNGWNGWKHMSQPEGELVLAHKRLFGVELRVVTKPAHFRGVWQLRSREAVIAHGRIPEIVH